MALKLFDDGIGVAGDVIEGVYAHSLQENSKPIPELDFLSSGSSKPRHLAIDPENNLFS